MVVELERGAFPTTQGVGEDAVAISDNRLALSIPDFPEQHWLWISLLLHDGWLLNVADALEKLVFPERNRGPGKCDLGTRRRWYPIGPDEFFLLGLGVGRR